MTKPDLPPRGVRYVRCCSCELPANLEFVVQAGEEPRDAEVAFGGELFCGQRRWKRMSYPSAVTGQGPFYFRLVRA